MNRKLLSVLVLTGAWANLAWAGAHPITGNAEFIAVGKPGFIKINGKGAGLTGSLTTTNNMVSGSFTFPLETLNTGVGLRDKHMKEEFLETPKFPIAKLVISSLKLQGAPEREGFTQAKVPFTGQFTVHGVTRPLTGLIDIATSGGKTKGDAQFKVKMSDYKFREAKYLGMSVNDEVDVTAHVETN